MGVARAVGLIDAVMEVIRGDAGFSPRILNKATFRASGPIDVVQTLTGCVVDGTECFERGRYPPACCKDPQI